MSQHDGGQVPVTALAFCGPWLLAGVGPTIKLYDWRQEKLLHQQKLFDQTSVHGFSTSPHKPDVVIAWGADLVTALKITTGDGNSPHIEADTPVTCPDWILAGSVRVADGLTGVNDSYSTALVTAHNGLLLFSGQVDHKSLVEVTANLSRSILYSAALEWESDDHILVASGTVFGEIIVWSVYLNQGAPQTQTHKVFLGHEGSPFGLSIAAHVTECAQSRLLASCGDDRSIRLWDISGIPDIYEVAEVVDIGISRIGAHTGFTGSAVEDGSSSTEVLAYARGHQSRIWGVTFLHQPVASADIELLTFGEDANCLRWVASRPIGEGHGRMLEQSAKYDLHAGKHIWSHALSTTRSRGTLLATGGGDGSISLTRVDDAASLSAGVESSGLDGLTNVDLTKRSPAREMVRAYSFVTDDLLLYVTEKGVIRTAQIPRSSNSHRGLIISAHDDTVGLEADLAGYCLTASLPTLSIVLLSGKSGVILLYHPQTGISRLSEGTGKTAGLFVAPPIQTSPSTFLSLRTRLGSSIAELFEVSAPSSDEDSRSYGVLSATVLHLPPGEVVTSFAEIKCALSDRPRVLVGCRSGLLCSYGLAAEAGTSSDTSKLQSVTSGRIHTDAITCIATIEWEGRKLICTLCRDGSMAVLIANAATRTAPLRAVHSIGLPGVTDARQLDIFPEEGRFHVGGFKRKCFVVWDVMSEQEVLSVDCGGSNRLWAFRFGSEGNQGILVWNQASEVHWERAKASTITRIGAGCHGREIKAMAATRHDSELGLLIATGAEDTDIKLSRLEEGPLGQLRWRCVRTIQKHKTGVQDLAWSPDDQRLISSGGFEELYVWRIRRIPLLELGVVCESTCPFLSEVPDLRVTAVSVIDGPATRLGNGVSLRIIAARSDSTVHAYSYDVVNGIATWAQLFTGQYTTCSFTALLTLPTPTSQRLVAFGTDGHGVQADIPTKDASPVTSSDGVQSLQWQKRFKLHQNAVLAADIVQLTRHTALLVSGGDDNSISISRIPVEESTRTDESMARPRTMTLPRAHAAAVSAVKIIDVQAGKGRLRIVSASLDQRLKLWDVAVEPNADRADGVDDVRVRLVEDVYLPVADVAAMTTWSDEEHIWVMLCGVGWAVWKFEKGQRA